MRELAWARSSLVVIGRDKKNSTRWTSFSSWSSHHHVHREVQALCQEILDMGLVIQFLPHLKDELKVLFCKSNWGGRR